MPSPSKETSMLLDIQYVKQNRKAGTPDYLYILWRNTVTQEKFMQAIPEPKMSIYFEKDEFRNHSYNKNYEYIDHLTPKTVKYKDIVYEIAKDMGPQGEMLLNRAFNTRDYGLLKNLLLYPYVYGADYNAVTWYRMQWLNKFNNDVPKKLHKGFMDIEVDSIDVPGFASPSNCPINAVTLIDDWEHNVYTFLLVDRPYVPKDMKYMSFEEREAELNRMEMYDHMHKEQHKLMDSHEEFIKTLHDMFDESYGEMDYKIYFYSDEVKMLVHLFQLINSLKLDIIGIWNMSFDIPYIIDRLTALGLDPKEVMSHPDFPVKKCHFHLDKNHHEVKNKTDSFDLTSYSVFICQMESYAQIRKGRAELRSYSLNTVARKELKDAKLDYSGSGNIKTLPYMDFFKFVIYNIKDVLLQMGIERRTSDFDTVYVSSYENATAYADVFKQTVKLRNVQYLSYLSQGLIPGENINVNNYESTKFADEDEDDDDDNFEGALVADPTYNGYTGLELYGKKTNNIHGAAIDFDMTAFYPSSIIAMNIDPSTLIFKTIMPIDQFDIMGGKMKYKGITSSGFQRGDDAAKECFDNFQTGNYMSTGTKWFNLPTVQEVHDRLSKVMKTDELVFVNPTVNLMKGTNV